MRTEGDTQSDEGGDLDPDHVRQGREEEVNDMAKTLLGCSCSVLGKKRRRKEARFQPQGNRSVE